MGPPKLFISYARKDKKWLDRLLKHLGPLERQQKIAPWTDRKIQPGADWLEEIEKALKEADIAVLLVTPIFLNSNFIHDVELPGLLKKRVIWIAAETTVYKHTPVASLQCVNDPSQALETLPKSKRNKALVNICEKILEATDLFLIMTQESPSAEPSLLPLVPPTSEVRETEVPSTPLPLLSPPKEPLEKENSPVPAMQVETSVEVRGQKDHLVTGENDGRLSVPLNRAVKRQITLRSKGPARLHVEMKLEAAVNGLELASGQLGSVIVREKFPQQVCLIIPPLTQDEPYLGRLILSVSDGALNESNDPRKPAENCKREISINLAAQIQTPMEVRVLEECLIFRETTNERLLHFENSGGTSTTLSTLIGPRGYEILLPEQRTIPPNYGQLTCRIRRCNLPQPEKHGLLEYTLGDGSLGTVDLFSNEEQAGMVLDRAIIGIDFGTTLTTVAFRECRYNPDLPDEVEFLKPLTEDAEIYPNRIWISNSGTLFFGSQADEQYIADPAAGFRVREIKTLLRDPSADAVIIDPEEFREVGLRLIRDRFGSNWSEQLVTEYLQWLNRHCIRPHLKQRFGVGEVDVRYVFSIPVLDYDREVPEQYLRQSEQMKRCIRAAEFPLNDDPLKNMVQLEFKPVCAAMALLHPLHEMNVETSLRDASEWPVLGSSPYKIFDGNTIAVFDSGGGTTDVVLMRVNMDAETGHISLQILRCLGVDNEEQTFGSEWVTREIVKALTSPDFRDGLVRGWYTGNPDFNSLYLAYHDPTRTLLPNSTETEEIAQRLKFDLMDGHSVTSPTADPTTSPTIRPLLLTLLCQPKLEALKKVLDARVFDAEQRSGTTYYLLMGDNTRLYAVQRWVENYMMDPDAEHGRRRLQLPEHYRQTAVAFGATWVPDARIFNAAPYGLQVLVGPQRWELINLPRHQSQSIPPRMRLFIIGTSPLEIIVQADYSGSEYCVAEIRIWNPLGLTRQVEVRAGIQNGELRVTHRFIDTGEGTETSEAPPLFSYRL